jgi:phytoene dehydrogenase-like protein
LVELRRLGCIRTTKEHAMTRQPRTVVVVGAGLAGLTAAATAADHGADVTLLEAREHAGGRARTAVVDGFHLNQGAHALYRGGPAWATLEGFGITPQGHAPDATGVTGLHADGTLGAVPGDARSLVQTNLLGWRAKVTLARLFLRPARLVATVEPGTSMQEWIDSRSPDPDLRAQLAMLARVSTYCGELDALDASAGVAQVVKAAVHGVVYLDHGWQQLVDGLQAVVRARGVRVHERTKVDAIEPRGAAFVVRTATGDLDADAVVHATGGPIDADALLHGASPSVRDWARRERPVHVSTLDLALRALPVPQRRITFGLDEPVYFSVHTPAAHLVDGPGEVAHLIWYCDADDTDAHDRRPRLEALLDRVQPGWRDEVVDIRAGRRLLVAHGRPRPGAGFGGRPPVAVPDLPGVFVAGDWVGAEGLLADAVFASARAAGRAAANTVATAMRMTA